MKTSLRLRRPLLTVSLLLTAVSLSGCQSWTLFQGKCAMPEDFASAVNNEPLKIPAGRDAADTRTALTIPNLEGPEAPRPADSPCIDTPPNILPPKPPQA
ncbi:MAG: hypothetical protein EBR00_05495 [Gammaproteobacteria bacterium]|jgi:hypothetical protein|nr:hypothetical protein [Gammaproteobacteria bacterium]